nr:hypothetical protein [Paenibacillus larvae]
MITAVSDVFHPFAEKRAAEYGIPHVYKSADELIESAQVDAVLSQCPTNGMPLMR